VNKGGKDGNNDDHIMRSCVWLLIKCKMGEREKIAGRGNGDASKGAARP